MAIADQWRPFHEGAGQQRGTERQRVKDDVKVTEEAFGVLACLPGFAAGGALNASCLPALALLVMGLPCMQVCRLFQMCRQGGSIMCACPTDIGDASCQRTLRPA